MAANSVRNWFLCFFHQFTVDQFCLTVIVQTGGHSRNGLGGGILVCCSGFAPHFQRPGAGTETLPKFGDECESPRTFSEKCAFSSRRTAVFQRPRVGTKTLPCEARRCAFGGDECGSPPTFFRNASSFPCGRAAQAFVASVFSFPWTGSQRNTGGDLSAYVFRSLCSEVHAECKMP